MELIMSINEQQATYHTFKTVEDLTQLCLLLIDTIETKDISNDKAQLLADTARDTLYKIVPKPEDNDYSKISG